MSEPAYVAVSTDRLDLGTIPLPPGTNPYTELFQEEGIQVHRTTQYQPRPDTDTQTPGKAAPNVSSRRETPTGSKCRPDCVRPSASQAHCSVCHATFGGVSNFDKHRRNGHCLPPDTIGLAQDERNIWRSPSPENPWWKRD